MHLDRPARFYLLIITTLCLLLAAAGIHGSSFSAIRKHIAPDPSIQPLLGTAKDIRIDEWNHHTPALLYQLRRPDRLAHENSVFGPHNAALLANLPTHHFSTIFRPQFWPFFILPDTLAFATWWQCKTWLLLTGVFLLLKLFARSTWLAIFGALWFYFSSFTQWWFSTPAAMPEMIGTLCFTICGICYLLTATSLPRALAAAILTAACFINCILCLYPSFLIPLLWIAPALIAAFALAHRKEISAGKIAPRLTAFALMLAIVVPTLLLFFHDVRPAVDMLANTTYPGHRLTGGGEVTLAELANHFLNPLQSESTNFAPPFNICEAAGFFWLSPLAILLTVLQRKSLRPDPLAKTTLLLASILFVLLLAWMLLPQSPTLDRLFALNHVSSHRAILALGLLNILITTLYLRLCNVSRQSLAASRTVPPPTDVPYPKNTRLRAIRALCPTLATLFLLPLIATTALINPIDRNLNPVDHSQLHELAKNPNFHRGKWLIFSPSIAAAPFFSAQGLTAFNAAAFIPNLDALRTLDPDRMYENIYNQSGYLLTMPARPNFPPTFVSAGFFQTKLTLDPLDPRLPSLNIRYLAFDARLDPALIPKHNLHPLATHPIDGFWLYEFPPPSR